MKEFQDQISSDESMLDQQYFGINITSLLQAFINKNKIEVHQSKYPSWNQVNPSITGKQKYYKQFEKLQDTRQLSEEIIFNYQFQNFVCLNPIAIHNNFESQFLNLGLDNQSALLEKLKSSLWEINNYFMSNDMLSQQSQLCYFQILIPIHAPGHWLLLLIEVYNINLSAYLYDPLLYYNWPLQGNDLIINLKQTINMLQNFELLFPQNYEWKFKIKEVKFEQQKLKKTQVGNYCGGAVSRMQRALIQNRDPYQWYNISSEQKDIDFEHKYNNERDEVIYYQNKEARENDLEFVITNYFYGFIENDGFYSLYYTNFNIQATNYKKQQIKLANQQAQTFEYLSKFILKKQQDDKQCMIKDNLEQFLSEQQVFEYNQKFQNQGVGNDWNTLAEIPESLFKSIGIKLGHLGHFRKAIQKRINQIEEQHKQVKRKQYEYPPRIFLVSDQKNLSDYDQKKIQLLIYNSQQIIKNIFNIINNVNKGLIGLTQLTKICFLSLFSRENIMIFGPPGTGKTMLAERIAKVVSEDGKYFYSQMNKFTTPEEIFGPISISKLKEDKIERKTDGYLPSFAVCVLDEVFKSSSSILNTLLNVLNERKFMNNAEEYSIKLLMVIGASNENPTQEELSGAFYDRFLFRYWVRRLEGENLLQYLNAFNNNSINTFEIDQKQFEYINWESISFINFWAIKIVTFSDDLQKFFRDLIDNLKQNNQQQLSDEAEDFDISERRIGKSINVLKVMALLSDQKEIQFSDFFILEFIFCANQGQQQQFQTIMKKTMKNNKFANSQKQVSKWL